MTLTTQPILPLNARVHATRHQANGPDELDGDLNANARVEVTVNGVAIGARRTIDLQGEWAVTDNPTDESLQVTAPSTASVSAPGSLDIGGGNPAGIGYTLASTIGAAVDLNQDIVISCSAGQLILLVINATVVAGAGSSGRFDVLSVNSGLYAGDGFPAGWPQTEWSANTTTNLSVVAYYFTTSADIITNGTTTTATFRLMAQVDTGTSLLLKNDVDGHQRLLAYNLGTSSPVAGQNTGQSPVTPPPAGAFAGQGFTSRVATDAAATISTPNFNPVQGDVVQVFSGLHLQGVNAATVNLNATLPVDTFGDTGGTPWTLVPGASKAVAAPNAANSNSIWFWRRTIGASPGAGHVTLTRNAGNFYYEWFVAVAKESGITEAPSQGNTATLANTTTLSTPFTMTGANSTVFAFAMNPSSVDIPPSAPPATPTDGGAWTPLSSTVVGFTGFSFAAITGSIGTDANWTAMLADVATSLAGFVVFDPSGPSTAAPGVETWNYPDSTVAVSGDMTWGTRLQ